MQYDWCPFIRKGGRARQGKDGHVAIEDEIRMMHLQVMECKGFLFLLFYFLIGGYFFFTMLCWFLLYNYVNQP